MRHVNIRPLTLWAKNKVRQHGNMFVVVREVNGKLLLKSLGRTYKGHGEMEHWLGWFQPGEDAEVENA